MTRNARYGEVGTKDKVWNSARKVKGKDPNKYRIGNYNELAYYYSYGKHSSMGWQIDHIIPSGRGGSNSIRNLQLLNSNINVKKSDSLVKKSRHSKCNQ
jgi:5-methylcytosine-specific restriction endonuclease McrA